MRTQVITVAVIAALAGCGGGGDEAAARHAVKAWLHAMASRDDGAACEVLTARLKAGIDLQLRQLGHGAKLTCRNYAAHWAFPPSPAGRRDAHIESVRLNDRAGKAFVSAPGGLETTLALRKEDGRWRIDNYQ